MQFLRLGAILLGIMLLGITGYMVIEGWPLNDAFYMTVISLTTVGYGEVHPLSPAGRTFTAVLLLLGVGSVFYVMAVIAENMLEGRVRQIFGRRKQVREINKLHDHHIVCGHGRIGRIISQKFRQEGRPLIIIDNNPEVVAQLTEEGRLAVLGDATKDAVLIEAGTERAQGLIGAMRSDADNVYVALAARRLNPGLFIVARADDDSAIPILKDAGADRVISPYTMGGLRMAESILRPKLASFFDAISGYTSKDWDFDEALIHEKSPLAGTSLRDSKISQETGAYVLAVRRAGEMHFNPGADFVIRPGDTIFTMGRPEQIAMVREKHLDG